LGKVWGPLLKIRKRPFGALGLTVPDVRDFGIEGDLCVQRALTAIEGPFVDYYKQLGMWQGDCILVLFGGRKNAKIECCRWFG
jgi:hypothetical protein